MALFSLNQVAALGNELHEIVSGTTGLTKGLSSGTPGAGGVAAGRGGAVGTTGSSRNGGRGTSRGAGIGAGRRGERGRKKKRPPGDDFFEDGDDWLDDDETSPGVLD